MRMTKTSAQEEEERAKAEAEIAFREQIFDRIRAIVAHELKCQENEIRLASQFCADLGADELALFRIWMAVDENFEIKVIPYSNDEEIIGEVSNIAMICNYVDRYIASMKNRIKEVKSVAMLCNYVSRAHRPRLLCEAD